MVGIAKFQCRDAVVSRNSAIDHVYHSSGLLDPPHSHSNERLPSGPEASAQIYGWLRSKITSLSIESNHNSNGIITHLLSMYLCCSEMISATYLAFANSDPAGVDVVATSVGNLLQSARCGARKMG
jgi:hypothetical protein